jgi:RNA polymerase sigma-70 factor (ECF subfamily)
MGKSADTVILPGFEAFMNQTYLSKPSELHETLEKERPRLVRLCTSWLNDPMTAEDVVQETLLEAWRKIETLRDPLAFRGWLAGIARNMSLRRLRRLGRDSSIIQQNADTADILSTIPAAFDLEVELDRADLARLLEQALGLLPAETRTILIQKYIEEASHSDIARQLGIRENVVAVRLHRGKVALRKVLVDELQSETAAFGLVTADDSWQETRIWCTDCGNRRMVGRLDEDEFVLRCPDCNDEPDSYHSQSSRGDSFGGSFKTFRPALKQFSIFMDNLYQRAIREGFVICSGCGRSLALQYTIAHYAPPSVRAKRGLHVYCHDCQSGSYESLDGLALNLPQGRAFFQAHPRVLTLPQREIDYAGSAALVVSFTGVADNAAYDVIIKKDNYELLATRSSDD